jgi:transcriptional regulator with XRE-family HTH domain
VNQPVEYMSVGERIAIYRRRRGLSQLALANMIGRSEAWLSQVERGIRHVDRVSVLIKLAQVLKVTVEDLMLRSSNTGEKMASLVYCVQDDAREGPCCRRCLLGHPPTPPRSAASGASPARATRRRAGSSAPASSP